MVVVDTEFPDTRYGTVENDLAIDFLASFQMVSVDHYSDQFRSQHHVSETVLRQILGVEHNDMVQRLHDDGAVGLFHGPCVDKRLVGNIVALGIGIDIDDLTIGYHQM